MRSSRRFQKVWLILVLLFAGTLTACTTPQADYVKADRGTYSIVAPLFKMYVQADPLLSMDQKDRRHRLISAWDLRITKWEEVSK